MTFTRSVTLKLNTMSTSNWRNYGIWRLGCILNFLESTDALIYEVRDPSGKFVYGFYRESSILYHLDDQFDIIVLDKEQYIKELKERIKRMKDEK